MRNLLIVYGTTEGQTQKIAEYLAREARSLNYSCDLYNAAALPSNIEPSHYAKIIVAAPVHMERHQPEITAFVKRHLAALGNLQTAFLSVSLSAAGDTEERSDAWAYTRDFLSEAHWKPTQVHIVAGALRFSEHDFFKRWAMRRLAKAKRADRENDWEYTDWAELYGFLKDFLGPAI